MLFFIFAQKLAVIQFCVYLETDFTENTTVLLQILDIL